MEQEKIDNATWALIVDICDRIVTVTSNAVEGLPQLEQRSIAMTSVGRAFGMICGAAILDKETRQAAMARMFESALLEARVVAELTDRLEKQLERTH